MSNDPSASLVSPSTRSTDIDATAPSVTVRLTESATRYVPTLQALYDADVRVEFPSVAAAYEFEDRLTRSADGHEYLLTPDHQSDATFFLRCQPSKN